MSWTYDVTLLSDATSGPLMQMRLLLGDTNSADQQMQDEELQYFLGAESSLYMAAAHAARRLAAQYARKDTSVKKVGDLQITFGKISQNYTNLADQCEQKGRTYQRPSAGGISVTQKEADQNDSDLVHPFIRRGMTDFTPAPVRPNTSGVLPPNANGE